MHFNTPSYCGRRKQAITDFSKDESFRDNNAVVDYLLFRFTHTEKHKHNACVHILPFPAGWISRAAVITDCCGPRLEVELEVMRIQYGFECVCVYVCVTAARGTDASRSCGDICVC